MRSINELHLEHPLAGSPMLHDLLRRKALRAQAKMRRR